MYIIWDGLWTVLLWFFGCGFVNLIECMWSVHSWYLPLLTGWYITLTKGRWRGPMMIFLIYAWINCSKNKMLVIWDVMAWHMTSLKGHSIQQVQWNRGSGRRFYWSSSNTVSKIGPEMNAFILISRDSLYEHMKSIINAICADEVVKS